MEQLGAAGGEAGNSCEQLGAAVSSWEQQGAAGSSWELLGAAGSSWEQLVEKLEESIYRFLVD